MKLFAPLSAFFVLLAVAPAGASSVQFRTQDVVQNVQNPQPEHDGHIHLEGDYCGTDFDSEGAQAILAKILADRDAGLYEARKRQLASKHSSPPDIGDLATFNVPEDVSLALEFQLVDTTSLYHLWVEVAELNNQNVGQSQINSFRNFMFGATPSRSVNPSQGIVANNNDIFGFPPNIDGDGIVDILMYDIDRGASNNGSVTLGIFDPADQLLDPPDGIGNERDIIYVDSNEGARNLQTLAVITAHEYVHLIHSGYGGETTFISEGYAEYAIVLNGYYWRPMHYFGVNINVTKNLFDWNNANTEPDYQRSGLFFTYIAEQSSPNVIGEMLRDSEKKGALGIDSVLVNNGSSISDMILNFHTANFVNDKSVDPRFGYDEPERSTHHAFLSSAPVDGELTNSGGEGGFTLQFNDTVNAGAVNYFRVTDVANFSYIYDTPAIPIFLPDKRARNRARILLDHHDGTSSIVDIVPGEQQHLLSGEFDALTFVFVHENPAVAVGDQISLDAGWTPLSSVTDTEDGGVLPLVSGLESGYPNPFSARTNIPVILARAGHLRLEVFDMLGRSVEVMADAHLPLGQHVFHLEGSNLTAGTYLVRMTTAEGVRSSLVTKTR